MINTIEFSAKNLTSNAGLLLLLEHASKNEIFDLIDHNLVFENVSTNKIKMNHIKTMLCGNFIWNPEDTHAYRHHTKYYVC